MLSRCAVRSAIPIALKRATVAPVVRSPIRHMCQLQQPGKRSGLAVWEWYKECLHTRPLLTKAVTSAVIVATGDILCQLVVERTHALNWMRVGRMGLLGGVLVGPCLHFWCARLSTMMPLLECIQTNRCTHVAGTTSLCAPSPPPPQPMH